MKQYQYSIIILLFLIACFSCKKDFLETKLTSQIATETYITNLATTQELLNGVYLKLGMNFYNAKFASYADIIADNIKCPNGIYTSQYAWNQVPDEGSSSDNSNDYWMKGYNIIIDCNYVIMYADRFKAQDPTKADNIKGQAMSIRGLVHHSLVNVFAQPYHFTADASHPGIPYVTNTGPQAEKRETVAKVYENIISDMTEGMLLMSNSDDRSKITSAGVKALLSRIYLYKGDYANSRQLATEVIKIVPMMNAPEYPAKLFTPEDKESIFWLSPLINSIGSTDWQGLYFTYGIFTATKDVADLLNERPNDLRKAWVTASSGSWNITKYPQNVVPGISDPLIAYRQCIIRSSELYLNAAECYAKTGMEDSSRYYLNAIRQRADNTVPPVVTTGDALMNDIYKERRKELCFEGNRMFDLLRTGKGVNREDFDSPAPSSLPYPSNKSIAPIPLTDVKIYGIPQNPGYH